MTGASKNWSATRLSLGTPASAACQSRPLSLQAKARPPALAGLPARQATQAHDRYTIGLCPSSAHWGARDGPVGCRTPSNGRSAPIAGVAKHFELDESRVPV